MSLSELIRFGALDDPEIDLAEAALLLAGLDHPRAHVSQYRAFLDEVAGEVFELGLHADVPDEQAAVLQSVIAGAFGFAGDRESYDDPANANLIDVIDRRRGLPVALSILYISAARSVGWHAYGINTPSHFLIRIGNGSHAVIQDPFSGGAVLTDEDVAVLLNTVAGPGVSLDPRHMEPLSNRAILVRLLNNIAFRAEEGGDSQRALAIHERMTAIAPTFSDLWWERARLEQELGRISAARASLSAMLETTRDVTVSRRIREALERLARSIN
ncbi:SirB1 family protein [Pedomonas mirosovicensis]|uniref:SirB1 family protein n=1 Tax=Pedomonas mirosovicensis TaxID=2908641 RepID=UPI002169B3C9|nr:transglutaminase-like domain-containing protein [Pedomonas mirosovicensis]MCH8684568.1 transglutaminase-like domain-containing protein [Pedomonas mirosovicensis]